MFGWTIIRKKELKRLERQDRVVRTLWNVHRWFSGWRDLDVIWDYVLNDDIYFGDISSCREKYAKERGTDVYGRVKDPQDEKD